MRVKALLTALLPSPALVFAATAETLLERGTYLMNSIVAYLRTLKPVPSPK